MRFCCNVTFPKILKVLINVGNDKWICTMMFKNIYCVCVTDIIHSWWIYSCWENDSSKRILIAKVFGVFMWNFIYESRDLDLKCILRIIVAYISLLIRWGNFVYLMQQVLPFTQTVISGLMFHEHFYFVTLYIFNIMHNIIMNKNIFYGMPLKCNRLFYVINLNRYFFDFREDSRWNWENKTQADDYKNVSITFHFLLLNRVSRFPL